MARHDHSRNAQIGRERARVDRTRAAHRDQRELARIESLAHRDQTDPLRHLGVDHLVDAGRRRFHVEPERLRDPMPNRVDRPVRVERDGAPRELRRVQVSQHHRSVGHRRLPPSARIACRAGIGGGGVRSDPQPARVVEPRDASPARADRIHVHHRHPHRVPVDQPLGPQQRLGAGDERDVGARAAHVEGDEILVPDRGPGGLATDDPGGGAGQEQPHRTAARELRARESAARLHHLERSAYAGLFETGPQIGQVAAHRRLDVRVECGDRGALVLPERRIDLARQRDLQPGIRLARDLGHPALVLRVDEREQQAHRDALRAHRDEAFERGPHRGFVERLDNLSPRPDPLPHPQAHGPRREKDRGLGIEPDLVHLAPHLAPDLESVAEPLGGDDPEPSAPALQHRVGRHRGAMRDLRDRARLDPLLRRQPLHRGEGRVAGVRGRARNLEHDGRPPPAHAHHIRECAAHVHSHSAIRTRSGHHSSLRLD